MQSQLNRHSEALEFGERSAKLCRDLMKTTRVLCKTQIKEFKKHQRLQEERQLRASRDRPIRQGSKDSLERDSYNAVGRNAGVPKAGPRPSPGTKGKRTSSANNSLRSASQKQPLAVKRPRVRSNSQTETRGEPGTGTNILIRAASEEGDSLQRLHTFSLKAVGGEEAPSPLMQSAKTMSVA